MRKWILVVDYAFCGSHWIFNNRELFSFNFRNQPWRTHGRFFEFSWFCTAHLRYFGHFWYLRRASLRIIRIPPDFLIMVQECLRAPLDSLREPQRIDLFFLFEFNDHVVVQRWRVHHRFYRSFSTPTNNSFGLRYLNFILYCLLRPSFYINVWGMYFVFNRYFNIIGCWNLILSLLPDGVFVPAFDTLHGW